MNLYIYLNDCYVGFSNFHDTKTTIKFCIKKFILNQESSGHIAVTSCIKKISDNSEKIFINKIPNTKSNNYALVTSGIDILKALLRKKNKFKKLIVGPNMVHHLLENNKLMLDERIDTILVPSENIKSHYTNILSHENIKKDIAVWPAFPTDLIDYDLEEKPNELFFIIYLKDMQLENISLKIINILTSKNIKFIIIKYGNYEKLEFYKNLIKASHIIFLGGPESQCIAQFEAYFYKVELLILANRRYKSKLELQFVFPNYLGFSSPYSDFLESNIFYHSYELLNYLVKFKQANKKTSSKKTIFDDEIFNLRKIILD